MSIKKMLAFVICVLCVAGNCQIAFAGLEIVQTKKPKAEDEAVKLKLDLQKLLTELSVVKEKLRQPGLDAATYDFTSARLDLIQTKLDVITSKMVLVNNEQKKNSVEPVSTIAPVSAPAAIVIRPKGLQLRTGMTFPKSMQSVMDVSMYLLEGIDYKLVVSPTKKQDTMQILYRPLPLEVCDGSIRSIEDALLAIAGSDTILVVDHKNKLVTFEYSSATSNIN